jgi:lipopolysaccharide transport system permease protein
MYAGTASMSRRVYSASPLAVVTSFWSHRGLIWQMTKRDIIGRYRGSIMGLLWSFFNPILMLIVYTFVFSVVFRARWGSGGEESKTEFALILFAGLIMFNLFSECVNRAPALILSNVNFVKKVVFPLEILPWVTMGAAVFHALMSVIVLLVFYLMAHNFLHWTSVFLPFVIFPLVTLTMGLSWFLASLGVFVRDVGQMVGILTTAMLFLSPIFYPIDVLPESYQMVLRINPLTFVIEQVRIVLIWGQPPSWTGLGVYFLISVVIAWLGLAWFQKTRRGFADVI